MAGARRHTSSLSLPSISGGVVARCAAAVVTFGGLAGGAGGGDNGVCRARRTAVIGVSGIMFL